MFILLIVLIAIVCALLIIIILVQNPKGGGAGAMLGGSTSMVGSVKQTSDFLERGTWVLIGTLFLLTLISSFMLPKVGEEGAATNQQGEGTKIEQLINGEGGGDAGNNGGGQ